MPSLTYGTPATSLTCKECTDLQNPVVGAILPKMGINLYAPRAIVFTTSKYVGLELDHVAAVRGFGWMLYLMGRLRRQDRTGKLMKMLIEFTHF
jgi:hypothetical protein